MCPCMFLIVPTLPLTPLHVPTLFPPLLLCLHIVPPLCASNYLPCLSLVCHLPCLSLLCPLWVSLSFVSHFVCPYLSPLCIPTSPRGVPCTCPQVFHFFKLGIGIDLVPISHILRTLPTQGVEGGRAKIIYIYIYMFFFARPPPPLSSVIYIYIFCSTTPPWSSVAETHACINPSGEME